MSGVSGQRSSKQINIPRGYYKNVLDDLDNRYRPVREAKERFRQLVNDLGGIRELSYQKQSLLWRFVFLEGWLQDQERRMVQGQGVDETKWLASLSTFTNLLSRIGLERRARTISPIERLRAQEIPQSERNAPADLPARETIIEVNGDPSS
jgi:hypothetical protein